MLDEPNELEQRLKKLMLTPKQEFIADRVFQLAEQKQWTIYQLSAALIRFRKGNNEPVPRQLVRNDRIAIKLKLKTIEKKVKRAVQLPLAEKMILGALFPWYKRLFSAYPQLSEAEIDEFIKNCRGVWGKPYQGYVKRKKLAKSLKDDLPNDAMVLWKKALAGSEASVDSELIVPGTVLNRKMSERAFCRGMKIINEVAGQLSYLGQEYGFEMMDLVQEAATVWWLMLKEWPGGTKDEFGAFVRETARTAIRGMFGHPALVGPSCAVPLTDLRKFVKQAIKHRLSYGEELSLADLREEFGWSDEQFRNYQDLTRLSWRHFSSITEPAFDDDKKGERKEAKIRSNALNPEEVMVDFQRTVAKELLVAWLENSFNQLLAPLEQLILRYRFGFNSEEMEPMSVEEVARILDTPVPVIVRLEDQALAKLRDNEELKKRYQVSLRLLKQTEEALK